MRVSAAVLGVVGAASVALGQANFSTGPQTFTSVHTFTFTKGGTGEFVGGFSIFVDYIGDGGGTWASDTNCMITAPDGQTVSIGGFGTPADLDYDYQGSISADPGIYTSGPHFGWIDGGPADGTYTVKLTQDFGVGFFNDFQVNILRSGTPMVSGTVFMHRFNVGGVDDLLSYDLDTMTETVVGSTGISEAMGFSFAPVAVPMGTGMWPKGTLFGLERGNGLYVIDTSDGSTTLVGVHGLPNSEALSFGLDGTLYANDGTDMYSISTVDGSTTFLGTIGVVADGLSVFPKDTSIEGFGIADAGDLIAVDSGTLYHIDIPTLVTTEIGNSAASETVAFGPDGNLYTHDFSGSIYLTTLDPLDDILIGSTSSNVEAMALSLGGPTIGYYTDFNTASEDPEAGILANGFEPLQIMTLTGFDLSGLEMLIINESSNGFPSADVISALPDIADYVQNGGKLMVHDRYVSSGVLENNPFFVGAPGMMALRDFSNDADIDVQTTGTEVTEGSFGNIGDADLDGGNSSSHGYVDAGTLPTQQSVAILERGGAPSEIVSLSYTFGDGFVFYSTIPLDFYLAGAGNDPPATTMREVYYPNAIEYMLNIEAGDDCVGDCNDDGVLNILDFVCFQGEWQAQTPKGDCDGNGVYNILDFVCFQGEWQAGCP